MSLIIGDWLDDLLAATAFLTRIPMPRRDTRASLARAYRAFPLVGVGIGATIGGLYLLMLRIGLPTIAAAALALGAGAMLTRALHEDGFADLAAGLVGARDKAPQLVRMRDSRLRAYGAVA